MISDKNKLGIFLLLILLFGGYTAWIYAHLPMGTQPLSALSDKGKMIWQDKNCGACHQIYGLGGYLGPDLTNEFSRRGPDYIKAFVVSGTASMPKFNLSEDELNALISYLKAIDKSGSSDPRNFKINMYYGTIQR